MVSRPTFDPNHFAVKISKDEWVKLVTDENHPLLNKAIQAQLAPGSTFKIIMATAGWQEGIAQDLHVHCNGGAAFYGRRFGCWVKTGHGEVDLTKAIYQSCDVFFYNAGNKIGIDNLALYAETAGIGGTPLLAAYRPGVLHPLVVALAPFDTFFAFQTLILVSLSASGVLDVDIPVIHVSGAVTVNGAPMPADVPKIKAAMLIHHGGLDKALVDAYPAFEAELKKNKIPYEGHIHPGSVHGFFNDATPERYNKTEAELRYAIDSGVGHVILDSFGEIARLEAMLDRPQDVLIRVTPGVLPTTHSYVQTGGLDSKFGFGLEDGLAERAIAEVRASRNLRLVGLHAHIGSQIFELEPYTLAIRAIGELAGDGHECATRRGGRAVRQPNGDAGGFVGDRQERRGADPTGFGDHDPGHGHHGADRAVSGFGDRLAWSGLRRDGG
jgi:hypothetical protein